MVFVLLGELCNGCGKLQPHENLSPHQLHALATAAHVPDEPIQMEDAPGGSCSAPPLTPLRGSENAYDKVTVCWAVISMLPAERDCPAITA